MTYLLCLVLLAVVCAFVLMFMVPVWRTDVAVAGLVERVRAPPLPPDTEWGDHGVRWCQRGGEGHARRGRRGEHVACLGAAGAAEAAHGGGEMAWDG